MSALIAVVPDLTGEEFMIVQILNLGKMGGSALKETRIFAYPKPPVSGAKPLSVCKADMNAKEIIELSYKNESIVDNVPKELRTF